MGLNHVEWSSFETRSQAAGRTNLGNSSLAPPIIAKSALGLASDHGTYPNNNFEGIAEMSDEKLKCQMKTKMSDENKDVR